MRRVVLILMVFAMACSAAGPVSAASQTANLAVSATMPQLCTVTTTAVNFGSFSYPIWDLRENGDVTVNCTTGTSYNIALDYGTNYMPNVGRFMGPTVFPLGGYSVTYYLYKDSGLVNEWGDSGFGNTYPAGTPFADTGTGLDQSHVVYGSALSDSYGKIISANTYSDTVTVTVHY